MVRGWLLAWMVEAFLFSLPILLPAASFDQFWWTRVGGTRIYLHPHEATPDFRPPRLTYQSEGPRSAAWTLELGFWDYDVGWDRPPRRP